MDHLYVRSGLAGSPKLPQRSTEGTSSKKDGAMNGTVTPKRTSASSAFRSTGKASKNLENGDDVDSASRSDGENVRRSVAHVGAAPGSKRKIQASEEDISRWTSELALAKRLSLSMLGEPTGSIPPLPARNAATKPGAMRGPASKVNRSTGSSVAKQVNGRSVNLKCVSN